MTLSMLVFVSYKHIKKLSGRLGRVLRREKELRIILSRIFPDVVGTYLRRETLYLGWLLKLVPDIMPSVCICVSEFNQRN